VPQLFLLLVVASGVLIIVGGVALRREAQTGAVSVFTGLLLIHVLLLIWTLTARDLDWAGPGLYADPSRTAAVTLTAIFAICCGVLLVDLARFVMRPEGPTAIGIVGRGAPALILLAFGGMGLTLRDVADRLVRFESSVLSVELRAAPGEAGRRISFVDRTGAAIGYVESDFELGARLAYEAVDHALTTNDDLLKQCAGSDSWDCHLVAAEPVDGAPNGPRRMAFTTAEQSLNDTRPFLVNYRDILACIYLHSRFFRDGAPIQGHLVQLAAEEAMRRYAPPSGNGVPAGTDAGIGDGGESFGKLRATTTATLIAYDKLRQKVPEKDRKILDDRKTECQKASTVDNAEFLRDARIKFKTMSYSTMYRETVTAALLLAAGYPYEAASHIRHQTDQFHKRILSDANDRLPTDGEEKATLPILKTAGAAYRDAYLMGRHIGDWDMQIENLERSADLTRWWLDARLGLDVASPEIFFADCRKKIDAAHDASKLRFDENKYLRDLDEFSVYNYWQHLFLLARVIEDAENAGRFTSETLANTKYALQSRLEKLDAYLLKAPDKVVDCLPRAQRNNGVLQSFMFFSKYHTGRSWLRMADAGASQQIGLDQAEYATLAQRYHADQVTAWACKGQEAFFAALGARTALEAVAGRTAVKQFDLEASVERINHVLKQLAQQRLPCSDKR
jgi:hypothetical protein